MKALHKISEILDQVCGILIVFMIVAFNWFPVSDMAAWLGFIISYALSMIISLLVTRLKERTENSKMQEALDKYNRRK